MKRIVLVGVLAACEKSATPVDLGVVIERPRTPRTQAELATTDGAIAITNLSSQILGLENARDPARRVQLVALYIERGQIAGRVADYEKAEAIATELVHDQPKLASTWITHASVASTFHRFDDALAELARAEKLGATKDALEAPRMAIAAARGDDVLAYRRRRAEDAPALDTLGALANAYAERGELKKASALYGDAQDAFHDTQPIALAMLYFQNGLAEQRFGSPSRARELFAAAHDRLPLYAQAASHLASVLEATGDRARAIAVLRPIVETADDPEYKGELAALSTKTDAATLRKEAADAYEVLLKTHLLAFADHAARFFLDGNPKRALELAQVNLANRATVDALRLVIDAAAAAGETKLACTTADALLARPTVTASARISAARAYLACGRRERGEKELATALTTGDAAK